MNSACRNSLQKQHGQSTVRTSVTAGPTRPRNDRLKSKKAIPKLPGSPILEGTNVRKVKHSPIHNGVLAGATLSSPGTLTTIHYTADNGQSWETVSPDALLFAQSQGVDFLFDGSDITVYLATTDLGVLSYRIQDVTLGTEQPQQDNLAGLYPNPASDAITVYTGDNTVPVAVAIYNLNGQLVLQSVSANFDISTLSKGIYIVKVQTDNGSGIAQKLIKK